MIERIVPIVQSAVFTSGISRMIETGAQAAYGAETASDTCQSNRIEPIGILEDLGLWGGGHQSRREAMR
jgi:hypothetical protein